MARGGGRFAGGGHRQGRFGGGHDMDFFPSRHPRHEAAEVDIGPVFWGRGRKPGRGHHYGWERGRHRGRRGGRR